MATEKQIAWAAQLKAKAIAAVCPPMSAEEVYYYSLDVGHQYAGTGTITLSAASQSVIADVDAAIADGIAKLSTINDPIWWINGANRVNCAGDIMQYYLLTHRNDIHQRMIAVCNRIDAVKKAKETAMIAEYWTKQQPGYDQKKLAERLAELKHDLPR